MIKNKRETIFDNNNTKVIREEDGHFYDVKNNDIRPLLCYKVSREKDESLKSRSDISGFSKEYHEIYWYFVEGLLLYVTNNNFTHLLEMISMLVQMGYSILSKNQITNTVIFVNQKTLSLTDDIKKILVDKLQVNPKFLEKSWKYIAVSNYSSLSRVIFTNSDDYVTGL